MVDGRKVPGFDAVGKRGEDLRPVAETLLVILVVLQVNLSQDRLQYLLCRLR